MYSMKARLLISVIASAVYAVTFMLIQIAYDEPVAYGEVLFGAVVFFLAFFSLRSWIEHRRARKQSAKESEQEYEKQ